MTKVPTLIFPRLSPSRFPITYHHHSPSTTLTPHPTVLANNTRFFRCGFDTRDTEKLKAKDQLSKCQQDGMICPISNTNLQSFLGKSFVGVNTYHDGMCNFLSATTANSSEPLRLIAFGGSVTAGADANGCCCTSTLDNNRCPLSSQEACGNSCSGGKSEGSNSPFLYHPLLCDIIDMHPSRTQLPPLVPNYLPPLVPNYHHHLIIIIIIILLVPNYHHYHHLIIIIIIILILDLINLMLPPGCQGRSAPSCTWLTRLHRFVSSYFSPRRYNTSSGKHSHNTPFNKPRTTPTHHNILSTQLHNTSSHHNLAPHPRTTSSHPPLITPLLTPLLNTSIIPHPHNTSCCK